jgi:hypothetical protein
MVLHLLCVTQGQHMAKLSPCDVKALQKCLQENKGDRAKVCAPAIPRQGRCLSGQGCAYFKC